MLKSGIRILALTGSPFTKKEREELVIGLIGREEVVEGALSFAVEVDGFDATDKLIRAVKRSRFRDQIKLIALNGITLAGFNVINISMLEKELKIPVIGITRKKPHKKLMKDALRHSRQRKMKLKMINEIYSFMEINKIGKYYVQSHGIEKKDIGKFLGNATGLLRLSHMIASAAGRGESKGRV